MTEELRPDQALLEHSDVILSKVHDSSLCAGEHCTIHNRSDHPLRSWRQHWRSDRGIMERLCPTCGCGIPDPDSPWPQDSPEWIHGSCVHAWRAWQEHFKKDDDDPVPHL